MVQNKNPLQLLTFRKTEHSTCNEISSEFAAETKPKNMPIEQQVASATPTTAAATITADFKVYKRRWAILLLFGLYATSNAMQWIQYSIINNIICKYYNISDKWVDATSIVYMLTYVPLIFPGSWFLDKYGLRKSALVGMLGTCAGAWIKVFSVQPHLFWLSFLGQTVAAVSQVFILSLPAKVAAVWFGPQQVSTACGIAVFGIQMGEAVGFLLPPILVHNSDDLHEIGSDLSNMFRYVAGFTTALSILMICFFQDKPPTPPSAAQQLLEQAKNDSSASVNVSFGKSLKNLTTNINFMLLLLSYGMIVSTYYALSTLLNPVVLKYFPGHEVDTGRIGLCMVFAGMMGSLSCGVILDRTHKFKQTILAVYICAMLGMCAFAFLLDTGHIAVVYMTASLLGYFMIGYLPAGFEFGAELTYPEPEGTASGLLMAAAQGMGIVITIMYSNILSSYGDIPANVSLVALLFAGCVVTAFIKADLRRQLAQANESAPKAPTNV